MKHASSSAVVGRLVQCNGGRGARGRTGVFDGLTLHYGHKGYQNYDKKDRKRGVKEEVQTLTLSGEFPEPHRYS